MAPHFHIDKFTDCDVITDPSEKLHIYMVLRGSAVVIADDRTYKNANKAIKKTRHKRKKAAEKLAAEIEAGLAEDPNAPDAENENKDDAAGKAKEEAKKPEAAKPEGGEGAEGEEGKNA